MTSFISPSTCGFVKVAAFKSDDLVKSKLHKDPRESVTKFKAKVIKERYSEFQRIFSNDKTFDIPFLTFQKKLPALKEIFRTWSPRQLSEKQRFLETFSIDKWNKLTNAKQWEHSLRDCKACYHYHSEVMAHFPVKSRQFIGKAKENPFFAAKNVKFGSHSTKVLKDTTKTIYNSINKPFEKNFGVSFAEAETKVPEIGLQKRLSPSERKKKLRSSYRTMKKNIEEKWATNSVERSV